MSVENVMLRMMERLSGENRWLKRWPLALRPLLA